MMQDLAVSLMLLSPVGVVVFWWLYFKRHP